MKRMRVTAKENIKSQEDVIELVTQLHHTSEDIEEGDIINRIQNYETYTLRTIPISNMDIEEWHVDEDLVNEIIDKHKENLLRGNYPPIILNHDLGIIDGIHRANALAKLGIDDVLAYVGTKE